MQNQEQCLPQHFVGKIIFDGFANGNTAVTLWGLTDLNLVLMQSCCEKEMS